MEENKRCKKCGAPLLADEDRCPICDTVQNNDHDQINEKKNYWKNPIIWTVFVVLLIISVAINGYLNVNPIELADQKDVDEQAYEDAVLTIDEETSQYAQATNNNGLAVSYVNKDKVYIVMNQELIAYDKQLNNREHVYDFALTDFKDDGKYYYYLDENNDYYRVDKESKSEDVLLTNVYYVQNLGEKIYYQKDSDNESIYCLDLSTNEDKKINDEVSYSLIIDEKRERIFYVNENSELISIKFDGSDRRALASNTNTYTYDGEYLYCITNDGLVKVDDSGKAELIYESNGLQLVNIVDKTLVVQDSNTIYTMSLNGKKVKKLYTMDMTGEIVFEVVGDKVLILARGMGDSSITYEMISLDGKRQLLDTNDVSDGIGFEI